MTSIKPEFPRPDRTRETWLNLNGEWEFRLFPKDAGGEEARFRGARETYNQKITVPFSWGSPLSGVPEKEAGVGWYRRRVRFDAPQRVFLCFGAVDYACEVFVNGREIGTHEGGYSAFEFDVTPLWTPGENLIEVRAEDERMPWQMSGKQGYGQIQGIWQTVWLEARPDEYIENFLITAGCGGDVRIKAQVRAADGAAVVARFAGREYRAFVAMGEADVRFCVENPRPWSPDDPYLYEGTLSLGADTVGTYFGLRDIEARRAPGRGFSWLYLNGKPLYINGTLDQCFNPEGYFTYPSDDAIRADVWRVKRLGLNTARLHIKAEEPRKLYYMDKLGVLAIADIPCFWGEPDETARAAYESEWPRQFARDYNHPCIIQWVMFNESWGLLTKQGDEKRYLPQTQAWVRSVFERAKAMDKTRLIEDNSPCRFDHVLTDVNTWHFYSNGYEQVRAIVEEVVKKTYQGSTFNYIGDCAQTDAPLMNSECGAVWGVDESAGDSDIAWQYHYMLNEFRLHEKLCGFVFTELNDVVNEFNGYYRIDGADKDFGYSGYCAGMTPRDLNADCFVATDCPPCQTVAHGEVCDVPLVLSFFSPTEKREGMKVRWVTWHETPDARVEDQKGTLELPPARDGAQPLSTLKLVMPRENAAEVLSLYLENGEGRVLSRNFTTFDVRADESENWVEADFSAARISGFLPAWTALDGQKLCLGGAGEISFDFAVKKGAPLDEAELFFEAGAKRVLQKDRRETGRAQQDLDFMRGYLVDRGAFKNSYFMTDESRFSSEVEVLVNGESIAKLPLENDWADARGLLSWHAQPNPRKLDEAGSYGEAKRVRIPSRLLPQIDKKGAFTLTFRVSGPGGLALYGRHAGRYPWGVAVRII